MPAPILTPFEAMKLALVNAGGVRAVAKVFDVATQNVYRWRICPAERVLKLEELSGVPRHELRPDLYPPEDYAGLQRKRSKRMAEHLIPKTSRPP